MTMPPAERTLSKNSTIYNYRLLRRIHHKPLHHYAYWLLTVLAWICALLLLDPLPFGLVLFGIPILHMIFLRLLLQTKEGYTPRSWHWSFRMPWFGYAPAGYISLSKVGRMHNQLLGVGLLILACLYPWIELYTLLFAAFLHIWLLLPRFTILLLLRKHKATGLLKINERDSSCYAQ
ncbi:hypothetical protein SAMN02799630_05681 [Paenibacillus sp. UNCCL117]|uniref:hypothetical protein n=1 Tax=unclassified Paenibacillus TaxID=185978 RepID=UPI0008888264|nr:MULTISPECIES: hypothetical protein [unclassified Paenibacillus]SDE52839.1 hypothetical protein SAMN04488602_1322 [Paenibacillus sp. cl123]SFW67905.1 hypothetical protein SAMN02799630_05681 [Paenibacillus sp. UNCCL117]